MRFSHEQTMLIVDTRPVSASDGLEPIQQIEDRSSLPAVGFIVQDRSGYPLSQLALAMRLAVELPLASPTNLPRISPSDIWVIIG